MKKERLKSLVYATPPAALDAKILAAARANCAMRRVRHRRTVWLSCAAAVVAVAGSMTLFFETANPARAGQRGVPSGELLAMNDWSHIEQENYNLACELNFRSGELGE